MSLNQKIQSDIKKGSAGELLNKIDNAPIAKKKEKLKEIMQLNGRSIKAKKSDRKLGIWLEQEKALLNSLIDFQETNKKYDSKSRKHLLASNTPIRKAIMNLSVMEQYDHLICNLKSIKFHSPITCGKLQVSLKKLPNVSMPSNFESTDTWTNPLTTKKITKNKSKLEINCRSKERLSFAQATPKNVNFYFSPEPQKSIVQEDTDFTKVEYDLSRLTSIQAKSIVEYLSVCQRSSRPKTTIEMQQSPDNHLEAEPINMAIKLINGFVTHAFKARESTEENISFLFTLSNILSIPLTRNQIISLLFKDKDLILLVKDKLLRLFYSVVNKENNIKVDTMKNSQHFYRCYIGGGNNSMLVRSILKQRWWWASENKKNFEYSNFIWTEWRKKCIYPILDKNSQPEKGEKLYNHLEGNFHLSSKKALFYNLKSYFEALKTDPFKWIPLTFHIKNTENDKQYLQFLKHYGKNQSQNIWIIKPGENTNRGNGISISKDIEGIKAIFTSTIAEHHTCIVQKYIEQPLLINKLKI